MKKGITLLPVLIAGMLSACTTPPSPQAQAQALHNEMGKLNRQVVQLTDQAAAMEKQHLLNQHSRQGAWLLPTAATSVALQSQAGPLLLSLTRIEPEANGTRALLTLRAGGDRPLQSMRLQVEWGELDAATGKPLAVSALTQKIEVHSTLLSKNEQPIPLRLSGVTPGQLGYVRVHNVELLSNNAAPAPNAAPSHQQPVQPVQP